MIIPPTTIQGPAYIATGGVVIYVEDDIQIDDVAESWTPKTTAGDAGQRHKSRMFKLNFKPVGMLTTALLNYFYEAFLAPQTYIGASIFPLTNFAVTIFSITENKTYGYVRGGIGSVPDLYVGPGKTAYGAMSLWCIGALGAAPTAANFIKQTGGTIGSLDTSFDVSKIKSDSYSGALGATVIGGMDGFMFKFGYKPKIIPNGDVGIADIILDSDGFNTSATFAPSNLTEAQVDTLLNYQGAAAVPPGQPYGGAANAGNLVLTGTVFGWIFQLNQVGARSAKRVYKIGEHRFAAGAVELVNLLTNTNGVINPLFGFTAGT